MDDRPQFGVELVRVGDDVAVVALQGEVDIYSAPQFKEVMIQSIDEGAKHIVVDLAGVTFIDSSGLNVLIANAAALTRARDRDVAVLVVPHGAVRRVFELTALDEVFELVDTLDGSNLA